METGIEPEFNWDNNHLFYCQFPELEAVSRAIINYKNDENLHDYLKAYSAIREQINEFKRGL